MNKVVVRIICVIAYYVGIINLFYFLNRKRSLILVYHNVIPDKYWDDKIHLSVSIKQSLFEYHLSIINKRLKVTTQLHEEGSVMITFDDGYSNAVIAAKCLEKYDNKAVFFIPVNNVSSIEPLWIDKIWFWFSYVPVGTYSILGIELSIEEKPESRAYAFSKITDMLFEDYGKKELIIDELNDIFSFELLKKDIDKSYYDLRFRGLSEGEIQNLKNKGFQIGGHSVNHDILSLLSSTELKKDFEMVSKYIGSIYNIDLYAYPYGHPKHVSRNVIQECQNSDFTHAVMNEEYLKVTEYTLPRVSINGLSNRYEIEARLSGFINICHRLFNN